MGTVASRFIEEAVFGISSSGSVRLTEIGRALEEKIPLHATHKRLSRNLADQSLEHNIGSNVLKLGSSRIKENTLLIVDPSDIQKKYAKKMQYLAKVRDAREDTIENGYSLCEVVGCEVGLMKSHLWCKNYGLRMLLILKAIMIKFLQSSSGFGKTPMATG
jgi:hypothetical protein